ncbi:MAG TPA: hypothetical protein VF770_08055, partial [Solirubrobacterales bacterium]
AAIAADPEAGDVAELRGLARETLTAAGQAAASLALGPEAERYLEQAAELADDDLEQAALFERAGAALLRSGDLGRAEHRLRQAVELAQASGRPLGGSAAVALASLLRLGGHLAEAERLLEPFGADGAASEDVVVRAEALAELAACRIFAGRPREAAPVLEQALLTLEEVQAWPALTSALITRAVYLIYAGRRQEGTAVLGHARRLASEHDLPFLALRASYNLAANLIEENAFEAAVTEVEQALVLARERGDRSWDERMRQQSLTPLVILGRWDEALGAAVPLLTSHEDNNLIGSTMALAEIAEARDDEVLLAQCRAAAEAHLDSRHTDLRCAAAVTVARDELRRGVPDAALALVRPVLDEQAYAGEIRALAYAVAAESALAMGDEALIVELEAWCRGLPPVRRPALLVAGRERLLAELAHRRGHTEAAIAHEQSAIDRLRTVGARPLLALALTDRWRRRQDAEAQAEAEEIMAELGAARWLAALRGGDTVTARPT